MTKWRLSFVSRPSLMHLFARRRRRANERVQTLTSFQGRAWISVYREGGALIWAGFCCNVLRLFEPFDILWTAATLFVQQSCLCWLHRNSLSIIFIVKRKGAWNMCCEGPAEQRAATFDPTVASPTVVVWLEPSRLPPLNRRFVWIFVPLPHQNVFFSL